MLPANKKNEVIYSHQGLTYGGLLLNNSAKLKQTFDAFKEINTKVATLNKKIIKILYKEEVIPLNTDSLEIHVEKIENTDLILDDTSVVSTNTETKHSTSVFKRMTLPLLKTYVIEKGLISDPTKMKKQDLINLIETHDI